MVPTGFQHILELSPWMGRLYRKFTGKHRKRVARKRVRLVKSYVSRDGRRRVSDSQIFADIRSDGMFQQTQTRDPLARYQHLVHSGVATTA